MSGAEQEQAAASFENEDVEVANDKAPSQPTTDEHVPTMPAHLFNTDAHPAWIRYGMPIYLSCVFGLLLASDLGSGVAAELRTSHEGEVLTHGPILTVSIFSSISKLWESGSYALAILIVITSICWPYVKLALSMFAWVTPPVRGGPRGPQRRERLIVWLDALGKWSFVDIFVLIIMMVAFRSSIPVGHHSAGVQMDVYIVPKWGFFGFVFASVFSLLSTHLILHLHRKVVYGEGSGSLNGSSILPENVEGGPDNQIEEQSPPPRGKQSLFKQAFRPGLTTGILIFLLLLVDFALLLTGSLLDIFTFIYERGDPEEAGYIHEEISFSIISIGANVPDAAIEPNSFGIRFVQAFYYLLAIGAPAWMIFLFVMLFLVPCSTEEVQRRLFFLTEITFAWGAIEVLFISAIFSVMQIPKFGTGIVDSGCDTCYVVSAKLLPTFAVFGIAAVLNFIITFWFFNAAHSALYAGSRKNEPHKCCWC